MKFIRRKPVSSKKYYTFEEEKKIFVITSKNLTNTTLMKNGTPKEINIPLYLRCYAVMKYSVLFLNKNGNIKFLYNPFELSEIKDISVEFHNFITENYDKI